MPRFVQMFELAKHCSVWAFCDVPQGKHGVCTLVHNQPGNSPKLFPRRIMKYLLRESDPFQPEAGEEGRGLNIVMPRDRDQKSAPAVLIKVKPVAQHLARLCPKTDLRITPKL
jgi:hypothetical protein